MQSVTLVLALPVFLAACAPTLKTPEPVTAAPTCRAVADTSPVVGNWLGARKSPGVTGELKVWLRLLPDGKMAYSEQLQRRGKPPQSLSEDGCWRLEGQQLVLQTLNSNGAPVEADDPIYTNTYTLRGQTAGQLRLRNPDGEFTVRRMPNDYRLPF